MKFDERRFFARQFRSPFLRRFKFYRGLNDSISSLQSSYSRHRRSSMNRTRGVRVRETTRYGDARFVPSKITKVSLWLACVHVAEARIRAEPRVCVRARASTRPVFFPSTFSLSLSFFCVSLALWRERLHRNVEFVTFHHCGLRYPKSGWRMKIPRRPIGMGL